MCSTMVASPASGSSSSRTRCYGLLEYSSHDNYTLQINLALGVNSEHFDYVKFISRALASPYSTIGFSVLYFVLDFYKMALNKKVNLKDLETGDYALYKGLTWMLCVLIVVVVVVVLTDTFCHKENDIMGVLDKTFSVTEDRFGERVVVGLRPGGAAQGVTEANKEDVDLVVAHRIAGRIAEQFRVFIEGLGDVLLLDLLRVFDEHELELLIEGMTEIGMDDWMRFTDYRGFKKTDRVIEWFWACLCSWPAERKLRLLQFMTGTSRIPVNDFKDLQRQRRPAPLHNQEEWQPESPPTQPHALESLRYAAVRGI